MKIRDICDLPKEKYSSGFDMKGYNQGYNQALSEISDLDVKLTLDAEKVRAIIENECYINDYSDYCLLENRSPESIAQALKAQAGELIIRKDGVKCQ